MEKPDENHDTENVFQNAQTIAVPGQHFIDTLKLDFSDQFDEVLDEESGIERLIKPEHQNVDSEAVIPLIVHNHQLLAFGEQTRFEHVLDTETRVDVLGQDVFVLNDNQRQTRDHHQTHSDPVHALGDDFQAVPLNGAVLVLPVRHFHVERGLLDHAHHFTEQVDCPHEQLALLLFLEFFEAHHDQNVPSR